MKLFYNGVGLHLLGRVQVSSEVFRPEPAEAPVRWVREITVKIHAIDGVTYADNRELMTQVVDALRVQHATLKWEDDDGTVYLERTATVLNPNLPEDPNEWGTFHQMIQVGFRYVDGNLTTQSMGLSYQRSGGGAPMLTMGDVTGFKSEQTSARFNDMRKQRRRSSGSVDATGMFKGDTAQDLATRRAVLLAMVDQWHSELESGAEGRLWYGSMDQVVRVDHFTAQVDQAFEHITWALSATWTRFPDETGYVQAEYSFEATEDKEKGTVTGRLSGSVGAEDEATAKAYVATIRSGVASGYTVVTSSVTAEHVHADTDGDAFIKISFSEELRKTSGDILDYSVQVSEVDDVKTATLRSTYSGYVLGKGGSYSAAYATAVAKATLLGDNKYQMKVSGRLESEDHQRLTASGALPTEVVVRVSFSYEYVRRGSRVYVEYSGSVSRDTFGLTEESVSGYVAGMNHAACTAAYEALRAGYDDVLMVNEKVTKGYMQIAQANGISLVSGEAASGGNVTQQVKYDFSFTIRGGHGGAASIAYELAVADDYVSRERRRRVSGTVWGGSEAACEVLLGTVLAGLGNLGSRLKKDRTQEVDRAAALNGQTVQVFKGLKFSEDYVAALTGDDGIIECSFSEEYVASGGRVVVLPTALDSDVIQTCGIASGKRVLSGNVKATSEALVWGWIGKILNTPIYSGVTTGDGRVAMPPTVSVGAEFINMEDGTPRTGTYGGLGSLSGNAKVWTGRFSREEVGKSVVLPV